MAKPKAAAAPEPAKKTVTVLRTCGPSGEAYGGFIWPLEVGAIVECPDWQPTSECGSTGDRAECIARLTLLRDEAARRWPAKAEAA